MNIFYLHKCPELAVVPMYNKHIVKMLLETAQLLCTTHHVLGNGDNVPYKKTHMNHPSSVWARENTANYNWLYCHFVALSDEYTKRYKKVHLSFIKCSEVLFDHPEGMLVSDTISEMPQCCPDEYKVKGDAVMGYRNYYLGEKHTVANKGETILENIYGYKR